MPLSALSRQSARGGRRRSCSGGVKAHPPASSSSPRSFAASIISSMVAPADARRSTRAVCTLRLGPSTSAPHAHGCGAAEKRPSFARHLAQEALPVHAPPVPEASSAATPKARRRSAGRRGWSQYRHFECSQACSSCTPPEIKGTGPYSSRQRLSRRAFLVTSGKGHEDVAETLMFIFPPLEFLPVRPPPVMQDVPPAPQERPAHFACEAGGSPRFPCGSRGPHLLGWAARLPLSGRRLRLRLPPVVVARPGGAIPLGALIVRVTYKVRKAASSVARRRSAWRLLRLRLFVF